MGRKLKGTKRQRDSQDAGGGQAGEAWNDTAGDPPLALIAVNSSNDHVAVACGPRLRVWNCRKASAVELPDAQAYDTIVRGIAFSPDGCYFLAGSDDKLARVWSTQTWELLTTWRTPKKISTVAFTADSKWALFADKFGDVFRGHVQAATDVPAAGSGHMAAPVPGTAAHTADGKTDSAQPVGGTQGKRKQAAEQEAPGSTSRHAKPALLLGHLCSVVTSVSCSPDGRFVATTDKDRKVRVSCLPRDSQQGAHEVQSICLGHLRFVTCSAFLSGTIPSEAGMQTWLLTGGGDGTVRLWDHVANNQLACWHVPTSRTAQGHAAAAAAAPAADCEGGAAAAGTSASPQNGQAPPVNGANPSPKLTESAAGQAEGAPSKTPRTPAEAAASHRAGDSSAAPDVVSAAAVTGAAVAAAAIHGAPDPAATEEADAAASQGAAQAPKHDAAAASDEKAGQYVAHEGGGVAPGTGDAAQTAGDQPTVLALAVLPSGLVAAAVEGIDQVFVLECHPGEGRLQLQQEVQLEGMQLPSSLQADSAGRLWVAGMPGDMGAPAACLGRAKCSGVALQSLVDDTQQLSKPMVEALEARHEGQGSVDTQHSQQRAQVQQVSKQLKGVDFSQAERQHRKRNRSDIRAAAAD